MSQLTSLVHDAERDHAMFPASDRVMGTTRGYPRLRGLQVCHLSPVQRLRDERAFSRESLPAVAYGLRPIILGPHPQTECVQGVEFVATPKSLNRTMRMLTTFRMAYLAIKQKADLYQVHSPEMIPVGLTLKLICGKTVVYDSREDFPSMMLTKAYLPKWSRTLFSRMVSWIERTAARLLDGVITADSGSLRPLAKTRGSQKLVLYNFPNLQYFPKPVALPKSYDLVYRGGLSERAGTFVLLEAVRLLLNRGVSARLLLIGYADNQKVEQSIREVLVAFRIEHLVTIRGLIPHEEMASTLARARVAVCPLQKIPKFMNNIPVKVFESWACGLPVIATDLPPIRPFFATRGLGLLVKPGDSRDLADAIERMLASENLREDCATRARRVVEQRFNAAMEIKKLLSFYERVLAC
jgi:glycosyltransferase involved in cell wall biosynthesis